MKTTVFLSLEEVLELHRALIEKFGGSDGIRELPLLLLRFFLRINSFRLKVEAKEGEKFIVKSLISKKN